MKPYFVEYVVTAVVMAEDEGHAYQVADEQRRSVLSETGNPQVDVCGEVTCSGELRDGWDLECIPYGGDGNTRIGEILGYKP